MITIEPIRSRARFRQLQGEWGDVLAASGSDSVELAHGWLRVWADTVGRARQILVLRIRQRNETIGFVPLMFHPGGRRTSLAYRSLRFLGDSWDMGNDFIIARDREAVVPVILSYPSRRIVCGELRLTGIPEASPNLEVLRAYAAARGIRAR